MTKTTPSCVTSLAASLLLSVSCFGSTILPPPIYSASINTATGVGNQASTTTGILRNGSNYVEVEGTPAPFIRAHVQETGAQSGAGGSIYYTLQLIGGNNGDRVPISIAGILWTTAVAGADDGGAVINSDASIGIGAANGNSGASVHVSCGNVARGQDCSNASWSGILSVVAWVGYDINVSLSASALVCCSTHGMTSDAYADPTIYIDPTFAAANPQYSLVFPVGVGNASAVAGTPEPASFLLIASALPCVVFLRRRRKQ